jgi:hypothetical protein
MQGGLDQAGGQDVPDEAFPGFPGLSLGVFLRFGFTDPVTSPNE